MALVYIRPDADIVDGSWVNESANNTNLYDSLNETSPIDTDYIRSSNNPANDIVTLRLSNFTGAVTAPMTVYYRYKAVSTSGDPLSLKVRLVQGAGGSPATTIAEWEHSDAAATYQDASQLLTTAQFNAISDFDDLFLEFEAITGALGAQLYAYGLLAGENSGFAIDATVYDVGEEAYVGGPIGGTLAVKGHTTNYTNVALDAAVLTQSGTSPKMVQFPTAPYVRWTPHNLAVQSETFNTSWTPTNITVTANNTTAPDGTSTADKLDEGTASAAHNIVDSYTAASGFTCCISVYVKMGSGALVFELTPMNTADYTRYISISAGGVVTFEGTGRGTTPGDQTITDVGSGWYRVSFSFVSAAGGGTATPYINFTNGPGAFSYTGTNRYAYFWGFQVNRGNIPTPYLATTSSARIGIPLGYDIAQGQYGVLIEPAATNLQTYSEDISNAGEWTKQNTTQTSNDTTAPDGSTTADKLTASAGSAVHNLYGLTDNVTSGTFTASCFVKSSTAQYVQFGCTAAADSWFAAIFDLSGASVTDTAAGGTSCSYVNSSITSIGNGWYRITVSGTTSGVSNMALHISDAATQTQGNYGDFTWNAAGTEVVWVWGFQMENSTVATSYIPTLGSTVTRATDNVRALTSAFPWSATNDTIYCDFRVKNVINGNIWQLGDGAGNYISSSAQAGIWETRTSTGVILLMGTVGADTARHQITFACKAGDWDASLDGGTVDSSADADALPTSTRLYFGGDGNDNPPTASSFIYRWMQVPRQVETEG